MARRKTDEPGAPDRTAVTGRTAASAAMSGRTSKAPPSAASSPPVPASGPPAPAAITVSPAAEAGYATSGSVGRVVAALGNNVVADLLGFAQVAYDGPRP